jgi:hypothetical protein
MGREELYFIINEFLKYGYTPKYFDLEIDFNF